MSEDLKQIIQKTSGFGPIFIAALEIARRSWTEDDTVKYGSLVKDRLFANVPCTYWYVSTIAICVIVEAETKDIAIEKGLKEIQIRSVSGRTVNSNEIKFVREAAPNEIMFHRSLNRDRE